MHKPFWVSEKVAIFCGFENFQVCYLSCLLETLRRSVLVLGIVGFSESMADLGKEERMVGEKEEEERLIEGVAILDFDVLCSTVASQSQGKWRLLENEEQGEVGGGVLRMWEGEVLDCFDDHRIAIESAWLVLVSPLFLSYDFLAVIGCFFGA